MPDTTANAEEEKEQAEDDGADRTQLWQVPLPVLAEPVPAEDIQLDMQLQIGGSEMDQNYGLGGLAAVNSLLYSTPVAPIVCRCFPLWHSQLLTCWSCSRNRCVQGSSKGRWCEGRVRGSSSLRPT